MRTFLAILLTVILVGMVAAGVYVWEEQRYQNYVPAEQGVNTNTANQNINAEQPTPGNVNVNQNANENANANANTNGNTNENANANMNQTLTTSVNVYLIALEDQGQNGEAIGCGDSVVPVTTTVTVAGNTTADKIEAALTKLFSYDTQNVTIGNNQYYNALYQSQLKVGTVQVVSGVATVELTGTYKLGGECDNPRFAAQLEQTALQFPGVDSVQISVNDKALSEIISLQ